MYNVSRGYEENRKKILSLGLQKPDGLVRSTSLLNRAVRFLRHLSFSIRSIFPEFAGITIGLISGAYAFHSMSTAAMGFASNPVTKTVNTPVEVYSELKKLFANGHISEDNFKGLIDGMEKAYETLNPDGNYHSSYHRYLEERILDNKGVSQSNDKIHKNSYQNRTKEMREALNKAQAHAVITQAGMGPSKFYERLRLHNIYGVYVVWDNPVDNRYSNEHELGTCLFLRGCVAVIPMHFIFKIRQRYIS